MDIHVAHGARFEPVVGISFDENCRSGRHEAVVMYDNLSGSGEQDAAGAVGSPEVAIVNRYVGIPRGVFDKIVFPECFIERLTQGDNKPLAAFPDNAFNAVPGPPRSGRSYNRPDLIIGFEHPFCREPDSEQLDLFPVFRNSDYPGIDAVYVQGIVTLSVAVAAVKFDQSAAVGKVERIGSTAEPTLFGTIDDRTNRLEQDVLAAESVNAHSGRMAQVDFFEADIPAVHHRHSVGQIPPMVKSEFRTDRQGTVDRPEEADRVRSDFTGFAAEDCIAVRERTVPGTVKHRTALRIVSRRITFGIDFTLPSLIRKADPPLFDVVGITFPIDSQVNMAVPKSNDRSLCDIGAFPVEREIANRQSFALLSQEKHQTPVCDEFSATAVDY